MWDWYLVFDKVCRIIDPEVGAFRIHVRTRDGDSFLGANGPFFSTWSPEECPTCGDNLTTRVEILLDPRQVGNTELTESGIVWEVVASDSSRKVDPTRTEKVLLSKPSLIKRMIERLAPPASTEEITSKLHELSQLRLSRSNLPSPSDNVLFSASLVRSSASQSLTSKVQRRISVFEHCHEPTIAKLQKLDEIFSSTGKVKEGGVYRHQVEALLSLNGAFLDDNRATVVLPTGCGKSLILVLAPYVLRSHRTLVVTPSKAISRQLDDAFQNMLTTINFFEDGLRGDYLPTSPAWAKTGTEIVEKVSKGDSLVIINAQQVQKTRTTVCIRDIPSTPHDLVIVDEAHHYHAKNWRDLIDHFNGKRILFLTATLPDPVPDGIPLPCNDQISRKEYEARGIIRRLEFEELDDADCFNSIAVKVQMTIAEHDRKVKSVNHQAMVLAQNISEAYQFKDAYNKALQDRNFQTVGYDSRCLVSKHSDNYVAQDDPRTTLNDFVECKFRTLVVVGGAIEGFDNRRVSVLAIIRSCRSRSVFEQFVGRASRTNLGTGMAMKDVRATIISHKAYKIKEMFDRLDSMTLSDDEGGGNDDCDSTDQEE